MLRISNPRRSGRILAVATLVSTFSASASAQSDCPEDVIGHTNKGNQWDGHLIGERTVTVETTTTSGTTSGTVSGTATSPTGSAGGSVTTTSGTTTTKTTTSYNVGVYEFENGSRYEVNCTTLKVEGQVKT